MSAVHSRHTRSTERKLRGALVSAGVRGWRCQVPGIPGKPDFVFARKRVAVFVDGCFWHGCPKCYRCPHSSRGYWEAKVIGNAQRDRRNRSKLRRQGWCVVRIWEHELAISPKQCVLRIRKALSS